MNMSTQTQITRIQTARNTLRAKAVELGIAQSTAKIDALATAFDGIENKGAVSVQVQEGDTYTIPKGYHNGSGTVSGVSGGGNYTLQSKTATPTRNQQSITPDSGYYGLSDVTVGAIPEAYQDVSPVMASAADVLANKIIVNASGETVAGTMPNNGAVSKVLDATSDNQSYTVPKGYHSGSGAVAITLETKSVIPSKSAQTVTPATGKVLSSVSVAAIPAQYVETDDADAVAANILADKTAYVNGEKVTGTMANNGAVSKTIDGLTVTSASIPAGYTDGGTISLTSDIEDALAAILGGAVMSVQSEITRISENVSAAFTAIAEKGVVVPENSKSDALAGLIGAIEVGVGSAALTKAAAENVSSLTTLYTGLAHTDFETKISNIVKE